MDGSGCNSLMHVFCAHVCCVLVCVHWEGDEKYLWSTVHGRCHILLTGWSGHLVCIVDRLIVMLAYVPGFMQDTIIASHTCFGGHMDVNC